ncbi:MAG: RNA polymerase sigma factor [Clostridiales bacterium]|nr:RNA polymerase sigma factor [Clostridiales bacterium]
MLVLYISMLDSEQDKKKMEEIYNEHKHALYMYALKLTGNQALAEDAVHSTFIAIIEQKEKYFNLSRMDFRCSSVIIVRNKCIDLLRKQQKYSDTPYEELEIFIESKDKPVEEQAVVSCEYEAIRKHLASIDEISRQVLIMKYYLGMSYKEIGDALKMTPKHVETRIMRAKEKVRKLIRKEGELFDE